MTRVAAALAAGLMVALFSIWSCGSASAGAWGATNAQYIDGVVCSDGTTSTPFVSWNFGTGSPAFLLSPVSSVTGVDSTRLPFATNGPQHTAPVQLGLDGFNTAADVATYATLIDQYGRAGASTIAAVAKAVMTHAGPGVSSCAGVADPTDMITAAAALAGPYTLRVDPPATSPDIGQPSTVRVTVLSAQGNPVPGKTVTVNGPGVPASTGVTDQNGVAAVTILVPNTPGASTFAVTASASAPIDLLEVSADHAGVNAVYPAPATTFSASSALPINPPPQPVVTATPASGASVAGQPVTLYADISGLHGHPAAVNLVVRGPVALSDTGSCPAEGVPVTAPTAATTSTVNVAGDGRIRFVAWTPATSGCYGVEADVATTNVNPTVTAKSAPSAQSTVAIIATTATLSPQNHVLGIGPIQASVTLTQAYGQSASVTGSVQGPVAPVDHSCAKADFGTARKSRNFAATAAGDAGIPVTSPEVTQAGCYRLQASATLSLPDHRSAAISIAPVVVQVITPHLATSVSQVWSVSPAPITADVAVSGTENQPAHVALQLAYLPPQPGGCAAADWTKASPVAAGASVAVRSDTSRLTAKSAPTKQLGCYLPIARLSIDANPAISVTAPLTDLNNTISVGVDPNAQHLLSVARGVTEPLVPAKVIRAVLVALEIAAVGAAFLAADRSRPVRRRVKQLASAPQWRLGRQVHRIGRTAPPGRRT